MAGIEFEAYLFEPDGARRLPPDRHARAPSSTGRAPRSTPTGVIDDIWRAARRRRAPARVGQLRVRQRRSSSSRCATATRCAPPTTASSSRSWRARSPHQPRLPPHVPGQPARRPRRLGAAPQPQLARRRGRERRSTTPRRRRRAERARASTAIGGHAGAPPRARGAVRADGQRVQAPQARLAVGLLGATGATTTAGRRCASRPSAARARGSSTASATARRRVHIALAAVLQASPPRRRGQGRPRAARGRQRPRHRSRRPSACRRTSSDALDELEADTALVEAVGAELVAQHLAVKRTEWQRFTRGRRPTGSCASTCRSSSARSRAPGGA